MIELFECARLSARITQTACETNRKTGRIYNCTGCPGLGAGTTIDPEEIMASTCKVDGCTKLAQHNKDGMCSTHFTASKQLATEKRPAMTAAAKPKPVCTVDGCTKQAQHGTNGMCKAHHSQALREASVDTGIAKMEGLNTARLNGVVTDPRITFECPHCHCALSNAEAEELHCPTCGMPMQTHMDLAGNTFTPPVDTAPIGVDPIIYQALTEAMGAKMHGWLAELSGLTPGRAICFAAQMVHAIDGLGY